MKFEWDPEKERINRNKHGVSFEQASYVFSDALALSQYDRVHSTEEDRWVLLGKSIKEVLLVVVHTFKNDDNVEYVRIISARKATDKERQLYRRRSLK